ncbi:MAG: hypothetical protein R3E79_36155 [Caldilineaceae bacterium]
MMTARVQEAKARLTMISTVSKEQVITGDEFLAMGDIGPSELVKGKIVPIEGVLAGFALSLAESVAETVSDE